MARNALALHPNNDTDNHDPTTDKLVNSTTTNGDISPADIRKVLSSVNNSKSAESAKHQDEININGIKYRKVNEHIIYSI